MICWWRSSSAPVEPSTPLRIAGTSVEVTYPAVEDVHFEHLTEAGGLSPAVLGELIDRRFPWVSPVDATGALDVELVAARVGAILLVAVPYEVFAETGLSSARAAGPAGGDGCACEFGHRLLAAGR